jgi:SAM-dependent methyltransferase
MHAELLLKNWVSGIDNERSFWREWIRTRGGQWPEDFEKRMDSNAPLDEEIANIVRMNAGARICDVGSGPTPSIGYSVDGSTVDIVAVDPLASIYSTLWDDAQISPPIRPVFAPAEELSIYFQPNTFDVVHCRNALDHSFDPMRGIEQMLRIAKVGGVVMLRHHRNEAVRAGYSDFHQFNFDSEDGKFVIWNKTYKEYPEDILRSFCTAETVATEEWISTTLVKSCELPPIDTTDSMRRAAEYLEAFVMLISSARQV